MNEKSKKELWSDLERYRGRKGAKKQKAIFLELLDVCQELVKEWNHIRCMIGGDELIERASLVIKDAKEYYE